MSVEREVTSRGRTRPVAAGRPGIASAPSCRAIGSSTREGFFYFLVSLALLWSPACTSRSTSSCWSSRWRPARSWPRSSAAGRCCGGSAWRGASRPTCSRAILWSIDYALENGRRWYAALALFVEDSLVPVDRTVPGAATLTPRVFFARVGGGERLRVRWQCPSPRRGKYRFRDLDLGTRSPFGIVEHRVTIPLADQIVVYPRIGQLTRRWFLIQRQATENRRGQRHDRSAQQMEYHGLRDYRSGDSPRWIHWRTSARRGELMVKEFEQQNEQDLAILVDPWLPRHQGRPEQREAVEQAISFAATVCLETCRHQGRRLVLGWTGPTPGVRHGPASVKLLHELLEQLAVMRAASEGGLAELFDVMPPAVLREAHPGHRFDPADQPDRGGRAIVSSGGRSPEASSARLLAQRLPGGPHALVPVRRRSQQHLLQHRLNGALQERPSSQDRAAAIQGL